MARHTFLWLRGRERANAEETLDLLRVVDRHVDGDGGAHGDTDEEGGGEIESVLSCDSH